MIVEPIDWQHQKELEEIFQALQSDFHEYSFANLFLFRHQHRYEYVKTGNRAYIRGYTHDEKRFLMPLFSFQELLLEDLVEADFFYPIAESFAPQASFLEADSDYLFSVEKMKSYPGRHLQGQRNHVHQFERDYTFETRAIAVADKPALQKILDGWGKRDDYTECCEAIQLMERLKISGKITFVEGEPAGFLLGEKLNARGHVLHFAKADATIKGIYPYMYQEYARGLQAIEWLNLEQDLGDPQLRAAKASYHPEKLLKKMRYCAGA